MAQKRVNIAEIGEVVLQKRRGTRSIRLTVGHDGLLRVTMPTWSPYHVGEAFVRSKTSWIKAHQADKKPYVFSADQRIGKGHRLRFDYNLRDKLSSHITKTEIIIHMPHDADPASDAVQAVIRAAAVRALKTEAKLLLPAPIETSHSIVI
jgi:predicted metal-dependent hydrolase